VVPTHVVDLEHAAAPSALPLADLENRMAGSLLRRHLRVKSGEFVAGSRRRQGLQGEGYDVAHRDEDSRWRDEL
jgi:hypothetical protein